MSKAHTELYNKSLLAFHNWHYEIMKIHRKKVECSVYSTKSFSKTKAFLNYHLKLAKMVLRMPIAKVLLNLTVIIIKQDWLKEAQHHSNWIGNKQTLRSNTQVALLLCLWWVSPHLKLRSTLAKTYLAITHWQLHPGPQALQLIVLHLGLNWYLEFQLGWLICSVIWKLPSHVLDEPCKNIRGDSDERILLHVLQHHITFLHNFYT